MSTITTLTNTTWAWKNARMDFSESRDFNINFTCNGENYVRIDCPYAGKSEIIYYKEDGSYITAHTGYTLNPDYSTIIITGGDDVENTYLIEILKTNATLQTLKNTKWKFKETITFPTSTATFNINFKCNGSEYTSLKYQNRGSTVLLYNDTSVYSHYSKVWHDEKYRVIEIIDGTDCENLDLLSFIKSNAYPSVPLNETNTSLSIYKNLSMDEYNGLEIDKNALYFINDNGIYFDNKQVAGGKYYRHLFTLNANAGIDNIRFMMINKDSTPLGLMNGVLTDNELKFNGINANLYTNLCFINSRAEKHYFANIMIRDNATLKINVFVLNNDGTLTPYTSVGTALNDYVESI